MTRRTPSGSKLGAFLAKLPKGTVAVGAGLGVMGLTSYGFLLIAARALHPVGYAEITVVWTVLFTIGPGLFLPLEQECARRISSAHDGSIARPALRRIITLGGLLLAAVVVLSAAAWPLIGTRIFNGDLPLFITTLAATACLWPVHTSRGMLAGSGHFGRYGVGLCVDGVLRVVGAAALALGGSSTAWHYAAVFVVSQLVATGVSVIGAHFRYVDGASNGRAHEDSWASIRKVIGWMLVAVLMSQLLANGGTFAAKAIASPTDPTAGVFLSALVIARIPLFLFAALQASLLPNIAALIARRELIAVRSLVRRVCVALTALGALATVLLIAFGPELLVFVFGPRFDISRWTLGLLSLGCLVFMVASALAQVLIAAQRAKDAGIIWVISVVLFLAFLALPIELTTRVSLCLLLSSFGGLLLFAYRWTQLERLLASAPATQTTAVPATEPEA
ncbi:O-antigen/teichoic acid export membrane protein [Antricoccus suffuscus]|uniref:O-antigen/teichoic acid export membrane protein n=1 Tax=Antricoccus suffuscus TaxID=1629062 RepID=A0A2T1A6Z1_9ACTN|nr:hypothetical protein [Antricoccus suffuscus]PRZ44373.1 O-antigen/teichoic acid export membrane protein [Antricoccus suffuscus]